MKSFIQSIRALLRLKPAQKLTRDYLISLLIAVVLALGIGAVIWMRLYATVQCVREKRCVCRFRL